VSFCHFICVHLCDPFLNKYSFLGEKSTCDEVNNEVQFGVHQVLARYLAEVERDVIQLLPVADDARFSRAFTGLVRKADAQVDVSVFVVLKKLGKHAFLSDGHPEVVVLLQLAGRAYGQLRRRLHATD